MTALIFHNELDCLCKGIYDIDPDLYQEINSKLQEMTSYVLQLEDKCQAQYQQNMGMQKQFKNMVADEYFDSPKSKGNKRNNRV